MRKEEEEWSEGGGGREGRSAGGEVRGGDGIVWRGCPLRS